MTGGSPYAQTNLQLYRQLLDDDVPEADVALVFAAYELALSLFPRAFRSSGKPFLSHLVGTASILHAHGARPEVTSAGLLHAAYADGEFPRTVNGGRRRDVVRRAVGEAVESLVHGYELLEWSAEAASSLCERVSSLDEHTRTIVSIRLANELEDALDLGLLFSAKGASPVRHARLTTAAALAERTGLDALAAELRRAVEELDGSSVPAVLRRSRKGSFRQGVPGIHPPWPILQRLRRKAGA